jgi:hypothetical protein
MGNPPLFSTFTLLTELLVTASVLYIFYQGYKHNKFLEKLVFLTLTYEIIFNISYMSYRAFYHETKIAEHSHSAFHIAVAAFHGIFAIIMFVALVVFFLIAWRKYKKGINFFREHKILTSTFILLWTIAISSGVLFYYLAYFTNT